MENSKNSSKRPKFWFRILLIGSLSLNLLIVGAAIGAAFKWRDGRPKSDIDAYCGSGGVAAIVRAMERSDRSAIREAFEAGGFGRDSRRATAQRDIDSLIELLKSDPLDLEGLESMLLARNEQLAKGLELGNGILVDRIASMPMDERMRLVERMTERRDRHKGKGH